LVTNNEQTRTSHVNPRSITPRRLWDVLSFTFR